MNFTFTVDELNILLAGLGELPAKQSFQLIIRLKQEGEKQIAEQNTPSVPTEPTVEQPVRG